MLNIRGWDNPNSPIPNCQLLLDKKGNFYLISEKYKTYISGLTDGININNLKMKDLEQFLISIPSTKEQDRIIKEAQTLADQDKYPHAIYKLTSVPTACGECYDKAMNAVKPIYQKQSVL